MIHPTHGREALIRRRTKIVATVGPASREPAVLEELIRAGVNVFRLNLSHGKHAEHRVNFEHIRAAAQRVGEPVAVLADLCGPKIRVGQLAGLQMWLETGKSVTVTTRDVLGDTGLIPSQYAALSKDVRPGDRILLDDGNLELRVDGIDGTEVLCTVLHGGVLKEHKGMNLPGVAVSSPALTDKDRMDALFALDLGVDFLALSFVRRPWDVADLKALIAGTGRNTPVIAKIEKSEAMDAIDEILDEARGLMVARGDLGVELPPESVPIIQRDLVERARRAGKPVIVATQMLESMITNPRPTRAEVSDVSTAVFGGADAVMLSAETAVGRLPGSSGGNDGPRRPPGRELAVAGRLVSIDHRARSRVAGTAAAAPRRGAGNGTAFARDLRVRAVVVRSQKGTSATLVSATRPAAPIVALTMEPAIARRLNLCWGVVPRLIDAVAFERPQGAARELAVSLKLAEPGQHILLLSGFGKNEPMVTVLKV